MKNMRCLGAAVFVILWTSAPKPCNGTGADCDFTESYDEVVVVSVTEPVHVTKYKWCLDIPPRCPDNKQEFRTVQKNITIPKIRTVRRCCKDQIQLYDHCVPKCTEDQCPNVQCAPDTDKCKCKPGYVGHLCRQKCDVGYWGLGCKDVCDKACADCDHRTGCCRVPAAVSDPAVVAGLTFCAAGTPYAATAARHTSSDVHAGRETTDAEAPTVRPGAVRYAGQSPQSTATREPVTEIGTPAATGAEIGTSTATGAEIETSTATGAEIGTPAATGAEIGTPAATASTPTTPFQKKRKDGAGYVRTVTKMEVTVYKYDELVKKLVWISAMTVVAIAMVFVIMFVVFFNCYGVSKGPDTAENQRPTAVDRAHEPCITHNVSYIPQDRYTKTPYTSTKDDFPFHPEIFCPVFYAPHRTVESTLYDSPQPLYEILC